MFDQLFTSPRALKRYASGPLLEERVRYLAHCAEQGSTRSSLRLIAQHQLVCVDYLQLQTADSVPVDRIHAAADLWVNANLNLTPTTQRITGMGGCASSLTLSNGSAFSGGCAR
jgi:hypothetical protein